MTLVRDEEELGRKLLLPLLYREEERNDRKLMFSPDPDEEEEPERKANCVLDGIEHVLLPPFTRTCIAVHRY